MSSLLNVGDIALGRYEVSDLIALSGQGAVHKGRDQTTGAPVAIKQLNPASSGANDEHIRRFIQEGNLKIGNPHIPDPIACAEEGGNWILVQPYIDGLTLNQYMQGYGGKLVPEECTSIIDQIADGLEALHCTRFLHRDVKPENILIQQNRHAWLIDLGIAKGLDAPGITQISGPIGTLQWMSPEQIQSDPQMDQRSDLYSLGTVFYWMLTGQYPVMGQSYDEIRASILQYNPPSPRKLDPSIPLHVDVACMRLLAKSPDARFASAAEFRQAIHGQQPVAAKRFCHACGLPAEPTSRFCHACGAELDLSSQLSTVCLACGAQTDQTAICPGCRRPFSGACHRLCFRSGTAAGREFRIPEGIFIVGRLQLSPRDCHISKCQAFIAATNGCVHIQDAGGINKTIIDGVIAQTPTHLRHGARITIAGNLAIYQRN